MSDATLLAIDPEASVWVSANAGSGKTYVLTRRVIRLLLHGVDPARILCLTYTKAAAANMQDRIFDELAAWIALDDAALAARIAPIAGAVPAAASLARARRLFAEAVETPGGLRIQTIHAFCERLLHLFPLEANVAADFSVLDDAAAAAMLAAAIDRILRSALDAPDAALGRALIRLAPEVTLDELAGKLLPQALRQRDALAALAGAALAGETPGPLRRRLDLAAGDSAALFDRQMVEDGITPARWPSIAAGILAARDVKASDRKLAEALLDAHRTSDPARCAFGYRRVFLTGKDEPRKALLTKALADAEAALHAALLAEQGRILVLLERRRAAEAAERSEALLALAEAVAADVTRQKQLAGALDFDDLIARTLALLQRTDAAWILYKLDGGIDHLLVDEAQDTSPTQWEILKRLTAEFFSGESAVSRARSVFAVGDEKQSIYSFQGADPRGFGEARRHFERAVTEAGGRFAAPTLHLSWRSSPDVLSAVDRVFAQSERRRGLSYGDDVPTVHGSARGRVPGLVEVWQPLVAAPKQQGFSDDGLDAPPETAPPIRLARRIARRIAHWLRSGACFEDDGRPIGAGDILILVRRRNVFFEAVIRALKEAQVPVAGADRLKLSEHIAVLDLLALARVMLLPEDDLSLAALLKSPLVGLDDDDLIALAPERQGTMWQALATSDHPSHRAAFAKLDGWRLNSAAGDPFTFYAGVLGRDRGRHDLVSRLGPDAAEAIDAFLADTLAYTKQGGAGLRGFVDAVAAGDREVKRDMEASADAVRVMTVHASKGLEARIVFLADTFSHPMPQHEPALIRLEGGSEPAVVWSRGASSDPAPVRAERQRLREAAWDEYRRLLYVGLTRARDRLYVAGARGVRAVPAEVWYDTIKTALDEEPGRFTSALAEEGEEDVLQWRAPGTAAAAPQVDTAAPVIQQAPLPDWLHRKATPEAAPMPPIRPSTLLTEARAEPVLTPADRQARRRGVMLHRLFERLAPVSAERRREVGRALLSRWGAAESAEGWLDEALAVLDHTDTRALFGSAGRAEVPIAGEITGPDGSVRAISGSVDRLLVRQDEVWLADFKTGRPPSPGAPVPDGVLAQLAGYRALVRRIYPGVPVRCFVLWTAGPRLQEAPMDMLEAAEAALSRFSA